MLSNRYNYVAPARVKVLVVPINHPTPAEFDGFVATLRAGSEIRLLDITPMSQLKYFNPQSFPSGKLLYEISTSVPDNESIFLHDFEPSRKTFIVLGVGKYSPDVDTDGEKFNSQLKKLYPSTIVQNTIMFDTPDDIIKVLNPSNNHSMKSCFYFNSTKQNLTLMETIMCEVSRNFLFHLDEYATSYQNITLRSPVSITNSQLLAKTINKAQKRLSSGGTGSLKVSFNNNGTVTGQMDAKNKTQVRNNGRQSKLMASFYLLAGKYVDALNNFTDALLYLRKSDDSVWLASALEGVGVVIILLNHISVPYQLPNAVLATVLSLSKGKIRDMSIDNVARRVSNDSLSRVPSNSNSPNGHAITSPRPDLGLVAVPELIKRITIKVDSFFQNSTDDFENTVPDIVYIESLLRQINFMVAVFNRGIDVNHEFYTGLVNGTIKPNGHRTNPWFTAADILHEVDKIFSLQLVDLNLVDQCRIYCSIASTYNELGMYRKKAFMLRTLLVEITESAPGNGATGSEQVKEIIELLFFDYGIDLNDQESKTNSGSQWRSIQLQLLKIAIHIFESLGDHRYLVKLYNLALTKYLHCLPPDDQLRLKQKLEDLKVSNPDLPLPYWDPFLVRSVKFIPNSNKNELVPFPKDSLPKSSGNEDAHAPFIFNPFEKSTAQTFSNEKLLIKDELYQLKVTLQNPFSFELEVSDISVSSADDFPLETVRMALGPANEGLFNGRPKLNGLNSPVPSRSLTQSKFSVNNPKSRNEKALADSKSASAPGLNTFDTNGTTSYNSTTSHVVSLIVPANSFEVFTFPFKALKSGEVCLDGLHISIGKCDSSKFYIVKDVKYDISNKIKPIKDKKPKDSEDSSSSKATSEQITRSVLNLNVIEPQPTLSLVDLSVTNGWLMLLEGEKYKFSIRLENSSKEIINYLSFSFWDSTIQMWTSRLSNSVVGNQLSALEIYELEWLLIKLKSFKILNKREISEKYNTIKPNQEIRINYEVTGKKNMTESKIILEYANKKADNPKNSFLKSIEVPLNLTVIPSIELINCDILPLFSSTLNGFKSSSANEKEALKNLGDLKLFMKNIDGNKDISDYCLIILDLRNSWSEELSISINFMSGADQVFKINDTLRPRKAARYLIPTRRVGFKDLDFNKRIPSLRNKQYVKDYSISEAEDLEMRQSFWLRENFLSRISGKWSNSVRHGTISFRSIRLTNKMVNSLMYSRIKITHHILNEEDLSCVARSGVHLALQTEQFYIMRTVITNYSDQPISGILRHLPYPLINSSQNYSQIPHKDQLNIDKKILFNGLLQLKLPEVVEPNQSLTVDLSFTILERGEYEWGSLLDAVSDSIEAFKVTSRESVYVVAS
ncbi:Trs120-domain-containing protein [Yamadazyma tenuis ATCC 10573]|uniref:Trs120-domain-containing protein n=1 Tax=Candida tenuis (strain ATCC 10573 / BCRC 21748 / CBS 615 / JCM 9827 / NBRC 10315 / NRRL Y-1498 / VKM Y-70) TaxID=590646 RepID=G3AWW4_CANTC|nr:Trs120-domain-containing protein [Yamadazyma tenuis ATCC 10573]EGV66633.1 Trs120-domain-containing protein [Yamadazyma tenuis ATCC 10573]